MTTEPIYDQPGLYDELLPRYVFDGRTDEDLLEHYLAAATVGCPSSNALEIGCGTGRMTRLIRPHTHRLTCVDRSDTMIRALRSRAPDVTAVHADARHYLAGCDERFDLVVACWSLNYPLLACFETNTGAEIRPLPVEAGMRAASRCLSGLTGHLSPGGSLLVFWFDPGSVEQRFVTETWQTVAPFPGTGRAFTRDLLIDHLRGQPGETCLDHHTGVMVADHTDQAIRWFMDGHFKSFPQLMLPDVQVAVQDFLAAHTQPDGAVRVPAGLHVIAYRSPR